MELTCVEVKEGWKGYYLFGFLAFAAIIGVCFVLPSQRQDTIDYFFGEWTLAKLPGFVVLFGIMGLCLFYYFDNRVKVKVDEKGIWRRGKGTIPWTDIWYFSSTISKMSEGDKYYLKVRLIDTQQRLDEQVEIVFRRMDKEFTEIRTVVELYAARFKIHDMGHDKEILRHTTVCSCNAG